MDRPTRSANRKSMALIASACTFESAVRGDAGEHGERPERQCEKPVEILTARVMDGDAIKVVASIVVGHARLDDRVCGDERGKRAGNEGKESQGSGAEFEFGSALHSDEQRDTWRRKVERLTVNTSGLLAVRSTTKVDHSSPTEPSSCSEIFRACRESSMRLRYGKAYSSISRNINSRS